MTENFTEISTLQTPTNMTKRASVGLQQWSLLLALIKTHRRERNPLLK
jgi:hypothetical protein